MAVKTDPGSNEEFVRIKLLELCISDPVKTLLHAHGILDERTRGKSFSLTKAFRVRLICC